MKEKLLKNKVILLAVLILILVGGGLFVKNYVAQQTLKNAPTEEIELTFDPEGSYALLFPRNDGNAIMLNLKRVSSYDSFAYELSYTDEEGISRGVGDKGTWINVDKGKSEYDQEILFGTCSKNVCKYDKGVENGTLNLWLRKGSISYRFATSWHLQQPEVAQGKLTSGDSHFFYKLSAKKDELALLKFTIINEISGAPKLPSDKKVVGKVYVTNTPESKTLPGGEVSIEMADNPPVGSKIAVFSEKDNKWIELETKQDSSKLTATSPIGGIFAVLVSK